MRDELEAQDFISLYLEYTAKTECPKFYHRWVAVTSLGAYLGRSIFFAHGHFVIHPNLYTLLIGSPGTKKSSAIKMGAKLLKEAGYKTFSAKKTRQEKFLLDLAEQSEKQAVAIGGESSILDTNLFGTLGDDDISTYDSRPPAECFIAADEFNNFIGLGNIDFVSILGELWDYEGTYDYKLKNSKSVFIPNPTISILGGTTPTGFSQAFPVESIGQGFFSRLLLVYGEPSGVKYTFPPPPDMKLQAELIAKLKEIKEKVQGEVTMSEEAMTLLHKIYHTWVPMEDTRFEHYANRRLTHLLKLCLVITASRVSTVMNKKDVVYANTLLTFTEALMPKALGEFGKAKHSDIAHTIIAALDATTLPLSFQTLWKLVVKDLDSRNQLVEIIANLQVAEKIQVVADGYLPIKKVKEEGPAGSIDWTLLTDEERNLV